MGLYRRDYRKLTPTEAALVKEINNIEKRKGGLSGHQLAKIPWGYYFFSSHFPNQMLDTRELRKPWTIKILKEFEKLLNTKTVTERSIQRFILKNRAYFIIASLLKRTDFGHHGAFLFVEFPLSNNHVADYLVIGKNSAGHEFIFVELEAPKGMITKKDGSLGKNIRQGLKQVDDWELWLEKNYSNLLSFYSKHLNSATPLPAEFSEFDKSRMHYAVIVGRRKDYTQLTYRKRRKLSNDNLMLLHYDNLIDIAYQAISDGNY